MHALEVFTVREFRSRTGDLLREAEEGHLSLVTKHGRPAFVAVPFGQALQEAGVHRTFALNLFESGHSTVLWIFWLRTVFRRSITRRKSWMRR